MYRPTDLDKRLLSALRKDGRAPVSALADQLGVSRATVTSRIAKLTAHGIIVGFTVRVRDAAEASHVRAISFIEVEGRTTDRVIRELRGFPEIQALHTTNGGWDLVAEVSCSDLGEFDDVLRRIRGIQGIVNSETSLLLSSVVR
ncbi:AsnC family transcriptional regulator [Janibacter sp. Soil728]|uniref:Lrp/AsnC family transcriptional regulator n=1 Tax=Janibacter sp. Soil728 TaxID=1736393 RepID=UPI0006FB1598|nr:Lrp/AsnC family transcriptional regulator [Janibacter sp. Soil728]KRE36198.1 AsnC family transcriptional regulator [Janibacter sp. Soil728]